MRRFQEARGLPPGSRCTRARAAFAIAFLGMIIASWSTLEAQDFYETRLRAGEAALAAGRPTEAVEDLQVAAFGLLERPALLCESLAHLALAESASGKAEMADAALTRYAAVARSFPNCKEARLDPPRKADFEKLVRGRLSPGLAEQVLASPGQPSPGSLPSPAIASSRGTPLPAVVTPTEPAAERVATASPTPRRKTPTPTAEPAVTEVVPPAAPTRPPTPTAAPPARAAPTVATPRPATMPAASDDLDRQPQLKATARPVYPEAAQRAGVGGIVLLRVLVSETGTPLEVNLARGVRPDLDEAAVQAVRHWLFEPGQKGGARVAAWMTVAVPFEPRRP